MWDEFTYAFPNFNDFTVEVWGWIHNFIPHFICDYTSTVELKLSHVSKWGPGIHNLQRVSWQQFNGWKRIIWRFNARSNKYYKKLRFIGDDVLTITKPFDKHTHTLTYCFIYQLNIPGAECFAAITKLQEYFVRPGLISLISEVPVKPRNLLQLCATFVLSPFT